LIDYETVLYTPQQLQDINKTEGTKLNTAINDAGQVITDLINTKLNTQTKQILDGFKLTPSGALNISGTQTALTANAVVGATSITVSNTTNFPSSGVLYLQGNTNWMRITYTGKTVTTFTGIPASGAGSITEAADLGKQVIGGPGIIITPKGLVAINSSGAETILLKGETGDATFAGTLSAVTGTLGTITAGSLSGINITIGSGNEVFKVDQSGIYLGNATFGSAPFRVDMEGRMIVDRLLFNRKAIFVNWQSLDSWQVYFSGVNGSNSLGLGNVLIIANTAINSIQGINATSSIILWWKDFVVEMTVKEVSLTQGNQVIYFVAGCTPTRHNQLPEDYANQNVGFKIVNQTLYALHTKSSEGLPEGTEYTTAITGINLANDNIYTVEYKVGTSIKFYVNHILKATHNTNLPIGGEPTPVFNFEIKNTIALQSKRLLIKNCFFAENL
jgi:hypothetical protein